MKRRRLPGVRPWQITTISASLVCAVCLAAFAATSRSASVDASLTCKVLPLTIEEIETRVEAGRAMPVRVDASSVRDVGPASPEVVAELEQTLAEADACGYDQRRALRWASNQLLAEIWPSLSEGFDEYRPEDPETFESPYIGITYVREMSDGRIGAIYMYDSPAPSPIEPEFYLLLREEGRLVVDEVPSTEYFETEISDPTPISGP